MNLIINNADKIPDRMPVSLISFAASKKDDAPTLKQKQARYETFPVMLRPSIAQALFERSEATSNSVSRIIEKLLKSQPHIGVLPEPSITKEVGKTKVTTLIDGEQIFKKTIRYIKNAEKSIQIEMFDFQSREDLKAPFRKKIPGSYEQQQILEELIKKKKAGVKVQVILDSKKWYKKTGNRYHNIDMIKRLIDNGIDVIIYPRSRQEGTLIQHVKFLAVDSQKVIVGGMNWGNHSPNNHDACVAIETINNKSKNPQGNSEVDNIIDTIFNKDWAYSWKMLGIHGSMTDKEKHPVPPTLYNETLPEADEYMKLIGNVFNKAKYRKRFLRGNLDLPEVKPLPSDEMKIRVFINSPREYKAHDIYDENFDNESIRTYLLGKKDKSGRELVKGKLDDPDVNYLRLELFALTNKEIAEKIKKRYKEKTLDVKILVDEELRTKLPGVGDMYLKLIKGTSEEDRVPIEPYKGAENQWLHSKWAVCGHKNEQTGKLGDLEVLIGSANWSAVGLENNITKGKRPDYEGFKATLLEYINNNFKEPITKLEKTLEPHLSEEGKEQKGIPVFTETGIITKNIPDRKRYLTKKAKEFNKKLENDEENKEFNQLVYNKIRVLQGYYELLTESLNTEPRYKRGNHECAVLIPNEEIARTFIRQFERDYAYTTNKENLSFNGSSNIRNAKNQSQITDINTADKRLNVLA